MAPTTKSENLEKEVRKFTSFKDFYPFYLSEHSNRNNRRLHFIGTTVSFASLAYALYTKQYKLLPVAFFQGYIWAFFGHFFIEKNKPASFKQPLYSFFGDMKMYWSILSGNIKF